MAEKVITFIFKKSNGVFTVLFFQTRTQSRGREETERIWGRRSRGAQRVMGRTNPSLLSLFPTILCVPLKRPGTSLVFLGEDGKCEGKGIFRSCRSTFVLSQDFLIPFFDVLLANIFSSA